MRSTDLDDPLPLHCSPLYSIPKLHGFVSPRTVNMEELKQLFASLEKDEGPLSLRNETMFKLLATTGMRKQELVNLTWEQIDLFNETIKIFGKVKKNASKRTCVFEWTW